MRNTMQTALAIILASTLATGAVAQTNDGTSAAAGVQKGGNQTNNDFAGGNTASDPAAPQTGVAADPAMPADQTGNGFAGGDSATAPATTQDGVAADAGTKAGANDTGNAFAGGDEASVPASDVVAGLGSADSAMVGKRMADVVSIKDVNVVTLTELSAAQNIDVSQLNSALAMQSKMLPALQSDIAASAVVTDALSSKGFTPSQVVGASGGQKMMTVVVDDRT